MSEQTGEPKQPSKPLYLSAEEAMGLLDLCLLSPSEFSAGQESVVLKLSDLVRRHLTAEPDEAGAEEATQDTDGREPADSAEFAHTGEDVALPLPGMERLDPAAHSTLSAPRSVFPIRYWMAG